MKFYQILSGSDIYFFVHCIPTQMPAYLGKEIW